MLNLTKLSDNVTEIEVGASTFLYSYKTVVAAIHPIRGYVRCADYMPDGGKSKTTERHINKWFDDMRASQTALVEVKTVPHKIIRHMQRRVGPIK